MLLRDYYSVSWCTKLLLCKINYSSTNWRLFPTSSKSPWVSVYTFKRNTQRKAILFVFYKAVLVWTHPGNLTVCPVSVCCGRGLLHLSALPGRVRANTWRKSVHLVVSEFYSCGQPISFSRLHIEFVLHPYTLDWKIQTHNSTKYF